MTVIAAVHQNGETWIGSDSQREWAGTRLIAGDKLIEVPQLGIVAVSGNSKAQRLIRGNLTRLSGAASPDAAAAAIRQILDDDKWAHMSAHDGKGPADYGLSMVLATPDAVYLVASDFLVQPMEERELLAIGSGGEYAMGAGEALRWSDPETRVRAAVEAAIKWDTGCGGPAHIRRVGALASMQLAAE